MNVKGLLCYVAVMSAIAGLLYLGFFHASKELRPWLLVLMMLLLGALESKSFPKM
jgi:hypothetical protein